MKLSVTDRSSKKNEAKRARREGKIPAVIYSQGNEAETIAVDAEQFASCLREVQRGHLPTTRFSLEDNAGKVRNAIIKDIQYHPVTYQVLHLDFEELLEDVSVNVRVPLEFTGVADCVGVKQGGVLRQVIRHLKVQCLPKYMPSKFIIDVKDLELKQSKKLNTIQFGEGVRPLARLDEVAVVIVKR
jgi:large subunit ribosomal protein L25